MAAVAAAVVMNAGIATADTIQSFSISGTGATYGDGPFSFIGEMSIDVTTDTLTSLDLGFKAATIQPSVGNTFEAYVCGGFAGCPSQGFGTVTITMTPDQADNGLYSGGSLVGSSIPIATSEASKCGIFPEPCLEQIASYSGEVAPATPLPAALPLFATGLGTMGLFGWRKKRKNAAKAANRPVLRD